MPTSIGPGRCSVASRLLNPTAPPVNSSDQVDTPCTMLDDVSLQLSMLWAAPGLLAEPGVDADFRVHAGHSASTSEHSCAPFAPLPVALLRPPCRRPVELLLRAPVAPSPPGIHSWKLAVRVTVTAFCRQLLAAPPSPPTCCCCCCCCCWAKRGPRGGSPGAPAAEGPRLMAVTGAAADCGGPLGSRTGLHKCHAHSGQRCEH